MGEKGQPNLTTDNFFPKEASSANLPWGDRRRSLTAFVLEGSCIFSLSCGAIKLIWKGHMYKNFKRILWKAKNAVSHPCQDSRSKKFTFVSPCIPPVPVSLRARRIIWLEASTSKKRAPSTWNSFYIYYDIKSTTKQSTEHV